MIPELDDLHEQLGMIYAIKCFLITDKLVQIFKTFSGYCDSMRKLSWCELLFIFRSQSLGRNLP